MAQTDQAAVELGAALQSARAQAGNMAFDRLGRRIYEQLGDYTPSPQTLRMWHRALDPVKADIVVLCAIANVYGIDASSLHPVIRERLNIVRELLSRSR